MQARAMTAIPSNVPITSPAIAPPESPCDVTAGGSDSVFGDAPTGVVVTVSVTALPEIVLTRVDTCVEVFRVEDEDEDDEDWCDENDDGEEGESEGDGVCVASKWSANVP